MSSDLEFMQAAVRFNASGALDYASDVLLEDSSFAPAAKANLYIFKIILLSGRSCCVLVSPEAHARAKDVVIQMCTARLGLSCSNSGQGELWYGSVLVLARTPVTEWPGAPSCGKVTEYQLLITAGQIN
eukprot:4661802-Amphidinium_carterae.1